MATIPWMAGARRGSIRAQLVDANGAIPLGSATVNLTARRRSDGAGTVNSACVIEDAANAIVRYDPGASDFLLPGEWDLQFRILLPGALPQYVPDGYFDTLDVMSPIV